MNQRKRELVPSFSRPASRVMIRKVARYEEDLLAVIYESLREFNLPLKDKTVLLKPNLVGLDPRGVMNTHPAVIAATRESFLKLGAARVMIGDGPAMDRDTQAILESVRLKEFTGRLGKDFCEFFLQPGKTQGVSRLFRRVFLLWGSFRAAKCQQRPACR